MWVPIIEIIAIIREGLKGLESAGEIERPELPSYI
jgi:hypothetical protein